MAFLAAHLGGECLDGAVGHRAVEAPEDIAPAVERQHVRVVGLVEARCLLQHLFIVVHQQKRLALVLRHAAPDPMDSHAADQPGHILQHRNRINRHSGGVVELPVQAFRPGFGLRLRGVCEAQDENGCAPGRRLRQNNTLARQALAFNPRKRLGAEAGCTNQDERDDPARSSLHKG
jgi:hypothetical protein